MEHISASPIEVTRDLLMKYDRPGPRYTSYPTAPEWRDDFGDTDYRAALHRAAACPDDPLSIYIHLPFCWERCLFCGCNVVISKRHDVSNKYLEYLYREITMGAAALAPRRTVKQMHWGGGTPTYLDVPQIEALFAHVNQHFDFASDAEIALEVDPRVTSLEQLQCLRRLGFNRISMGVQDLDPTVQKAIGRNQTVEETRTLFAHCRELGFSGINIDLIYGLPEQNETTWANTIREVIDIRPDRLAVYSYAHLPSTIKHQKRIDGLPRPAGPEKFELFAIARRLFLEAGYRIVGMDHFALPEDELSIALDERRLHRNFMGYTVVPAADMIGFGVSAIGEIGGAYAQNEKRPVQYYAALDAGHLPTHVGIHLTDDDEIRRWVIRQLMCNFYLDTQALENRYGVSYDGYFGNEERDLQPFYAEGFLERQDGNLVVLPLGQVFIRNIAMVFDAYLKKPEHFSAFSRTV
jgi:oxygen-independent coproporphyrinogen-3 oxidase